MSASRRFRRRAALAAALVPVLVLLTTAVVVAPANAGEYRPAVSVTRGVAFGFGFPGLAGIARDTDGHIFLPTNSTFFEYNLVAELARKAPPATGWAHVGTWDPFPGDNAFESRSVAVKPDGSAVYVTDNDGADFNLTEITRSGDTRIVARGAASVDVAADGTLYVGPYQVNEPARRIAPNGTVTELPFSGSFDLDKVALGPDGDLYATELGNNTVQRRDAQTGATTQLSRGLPGPPTALDVGSDGSVYVGVGARVMILSPGATTWRSVPAPGDVTGIVAAPDGTLFVSTGSDAFELEPAIHSTLSLESGAGPVPAGAPVSVTATLTPQEADPAPTGAVQFAVDDVVNAGFGDLTPAGDGRWSATFSTTELTPGEHTLTAVWIGDDDHAVASAAPVTVTVTDPPPPPPDDGDNGGGTPGGGDQGGVPPGGAGTPPGGGQQPGPTPPSAVPPPSGGLVSRPPAPRQQRCMAPRSLRLRLVAPSRRTRLLAVKARLGRQTLKRVPQGRAHAGRAGSAGTGARDAAMARRAAGGRATTLVMRLPRIAHPHPRVTVTVTARTPSGRRLSATVSYRRCTAAGSTVAATARLRLTRAAR